MKYLIVYLVLGFLFMGGARAGGVPLSTHCKVSILTCDPGTAPYAIFGHSAIRVNDSSSAVDVVFNYGTFDFDDPHFYSKFLGGRLTYFLSALPFLEFLEEYREDHKRVREQVLNLGLQEKQLLFERLLENLKEQNRYYKYDFFYDNCSTRIRDDIQWLFGSRLRADDSVVIEHKNFRQEIRKYFVYNPWAGFGIDICLGLPADRRPSREERMFLPQNLFDAMEHSSIGDGERLVSTAVVFDFRDKSGSLPTWGWNSPVGLCWVLFVIGIFTVIVEVKTKRRLAVFDVLLFTLTGMVGFALLYLWIFTDYSVVRSNLNLLWANPLNFFVILSPGLRKGYFLVYSIVLSLLLVFFLIVPYYFDPVVFPLVLTMGIRSVLLSLRRNKIIHDRFPEQGWR